MRTDWTTGHSYQSNIPFFQNNESFSFTVGVQNSAEENILSTESTDEQLVERQSPAISEDTSQKTLEEVQQITDEIFAERIGSMEMTEPTAEQVSTRRVRFSSTNQYYEPTSYPKNSEEESRENRTCDKKSHNQELYDLFAYIERMQEEEKRSALVSHSNVSNQPKTPSRLSERVPSLSLDDGINIGTSARVESLEDDELDLFCEMQLPSFAETQNLVDGGGETASIEQPEPSILSDRKARSSGEKLETPEGSRSSSFSSNESFGVGDVRLPIQYAPQGNGLPVIIPKKSNTPPLIQIGSPVRQLAPNRVQLEVAPSPIDQMAQKVIEKLREVQSDGTNQGLHLFRVLQGTDISIMTLYLAYKKLIQKDPHYVNSKVTECFELLRSIVQKRESELTEKRGKWYLKMPVVFSATKMGREYVTNFDNLNPS